MTLPGRTVARAAALGGVLALGACAVAAPSGPTVMAVPPKGKPLSQFQQDDLACRQYAATRVGGTTPSQAATNAGVGSALLGAAIGAGAGAAIGSVGAEVGAGAAIGGAAGLLLGSLIGANNAQASAYSLQQSYNIGYAQCMVAHGNKIEPMPGSYAAYPYPTYSYPYYYGYYGYPYAFGPGVGFGWDGDAAARDDLSYPARVPAFRCPPPIARGARR